MRGRLVVYVLFSLFYLAIMLRNLPYFVRFLRRDHQLHPMTPFEIVGMLALYVFIAWAPIAIGRFVAGGEPPQKAPHDAHKVV